MTTLGKDIQVSDAMALLIKRFRKFAFNSVLAEARFETLGPEYWYCLRLILDEDCKTIHPLE